jgi:hypothetical protein
MEIWKNLLFGNWIGILSLITIFAALGIIVYLGFWLNKKAHEKA